MNFSLQATHFDIIDSEKVVGIARYEGMESYKLIEEMMLAANQCAARLIKESCEYGVYRVHPDPSEQKVQLLNASLKPLDLALTPPYTLPKIQQLSEKLQQQYPRLAPCIARIMQRASYQVHPEPHFGLNFDLYTHFTSPIRRYPDLLVHRLIYAIIEKKNLKPLYKNLKMALDRVNYLERRAEEADRQYQTYLKARFAEELEGQIFQAIVTGFTEHGLFVELDDYPLEGMVHFSQIDGSFWQYLPDQGKIVSSNNAQFVLGDTLTVQLVEVDLAQSRLNFSVVRDS
jgi:ribonuclease R